MSVQFVLGSSGSGKSYYIYNKIVEESYQNMRKQFLVVVPEQFTMQTQRTLVSLHKNHSIQNIDILSFERLAYRIFDELGVKCDNVLEESGKQLLIKKVAEEKKDELSILKKNITRTGYVSELKSLISELMQYGIKPEDIDNLKNDSSGMLSHKLSDVSVIYKAFLEELEGSFITSEEILSLLISVAHKSKILKDSCIVFDGYTGFTPVQKELIAELLPLSSEVYFTADIDKLEGFYDKENHEPVVTEVKYIKEHDLFAMSKTMIIQIFNMAKTADTEWRDPVFFDGSKGRLTGSDELAFLEKHLFRNDNCTFDSKPENISLLSAKNPVEELKATAGVISRLVRDEGMRYKDIAIVCGNVDTYSPYLKDVFSKYDIPVFMDEKRELLKHPFVEYLRALMDMLDRNFTYDTVFRFLRSGFSVIEDSECDLLDNYVRATGIKGKKGWSTEFDYMPKDLSMELDYIENLRLIFADDIMPLNEALKKKGVTVEERCKALIDYLEQSGCEEKLLERKAYFEKEQDLKRADEYGQIYGIVTALLEKMINLIGSSKMPFRDFTELMDAAMESSKIGIIPPGYDRVVVGDIERTRLNDVKALFLLGANDGNIPRLNAGGGIISEAEREVIKEHDIELAPSEREQAFMQKFYLYMVLTKPSERLYVSYYRVGMDGKPERRSYLIGALEGLFKAIRVTNIETDGDSLGLLTNDGLHEEIASRLSGTLGKFDSEFVSAAIKWQKNNNEEGYARLMKLLKAATEEYKAMPLPAEAVKGIYGEKLYGSITRLERFAACEYAHFLMYGLKLREREELSYGGLDMGNIVHASLERYAQFLKNNNIRWREVSDEVSDRFLAEALEEAINENYNPAIFEDARSKYTLKRIERYLRRTVKVIKDQVRAGRFEPTDFEKRFETQYGVTNIVGKIDRIDTAEIDGEIYINVIDYKTGAASLSLNSVFAGEQLQLATYMIMALKMYSERFPEKNVRPGGLFYYHVKDDMIDGTLEMDAESVQKSIEKACRLSGLYNDSPAYYNNMDFGLRECGFDSNVIKANTKKDGTLSSRSDAMPEEKMKELLDFVDSEIKSLSDEIYMGNIAVNPTTDGRDKTACTYCSMKSVCGFDVRRKGYEYKTLKNETISEEVRNGD
ncbi:MAG: exodeoxyribonuclease V subunit gamma [Lachnospiraceae bacterium]|nr:exodeoxyribonuclease V subunit gamma [Lachnospiraceae bacterium]